MNIKRYEHGDDGWGWSGMSNDDTGDYVLYTDHIASLEAVTVKAEPVKPLLATRFKLSFDHKGRCTTFRKDQVEKLFGEWVWLIEATDGMNDPLYSAPALEAVKAERDSLSEAMLSLGMAHEATVKAALEAVKATVKPLEWEAPSVSTNQCWTAKSPFGTYSVVNEDGWYAAREPEGFWEWNGDRIIDTRHTAFTACQADYERRILSALVSSPTLEAKMEGK